LPLLGPSRKKNGFFSVGKDPFFRGGGPARQVALIEGLARTRLLGWRCCSHQAGCPHARGRAGRTRAGSTDPQGACARAPPGRDRGGADCFMEREPTESNLRRRRKCRSRRFGRSANWRRRRAMLAMRMARFSGAGKFPCQPLGTGSFPRRTTGSRLLRGVVEAAIARSRPAGHDLRGYTSRSTIADLLWSGYHQAAGGLSARRRVRSCAKTPISGNCEAQCSRFPALRHGRVPSWVMPIKALRSKLWSDVAALELQGSLCRRGIPRRMSTRFGFRDRGATGSSFRSVGPIRRWWVRWGLTVRLCFPAGICSECEGEDRFVRLPCWRKPLPPPPQIVLGTEVAYQTTATTTMR